MNGHNRTTKYNEDGTSKRKPHSHLAGYIAELKNRRTGIGYVVIYRALLQGVDAGILPYIVVCETHHTLVAVSSIPKARTAMKSVDFCEECMATQKTQEQS